MTFDDACTLTVIDAGGGLFTFNQTAGWSGPNTGYYNLTSGGAAQTGSQFAIWDEGSENDLIGIISPRTSTYQYRTIRCVWSVHLIIANILNGPPPAAHPYNGALAVESVQISGMVGSDINGNPTGLIAAPVTGVAYYTYARLKIRYSPWISYTVDVDYGVEPLVVAGASGATYKWPDGTQLDPSEVPVVRQQTQSLVLTSYDHLTVPDFRTYDGMVNSVAITIAQLSSTPYAIGTLLMDGASTQTIVQSTGQPYKSFKAIFKWLPNGWNKFYRPSTGTWQAVTDNAGNPPYASVDFSSLFA